MTADEIIDGVIAREGGWRDQVTRPDGTIDPATNFGITLPMLQAWRDDDRLPEIALKGMPQSEAAQIYQARFIDDPGFTATNIPFEPLRVQLIDFGVNSNPARAVRWLQRVLGFIPAQVTGELDALTLGNLRALEGYGISAIVNDALVAARCRMIVGAVAAGSIRKADELGLLTRAVSFTLAQS